ncbi:MAG: NHL repeat-containing protein, partial [Candidatus Omnitrophica bacterium]|nr:NHL repeat-containing protein [Candidatus Omnitrophota bacterium]
MPALEPIDLPDGTLDRPRPISPELALGSPNNDEERFSLPRGMASDPSGNLHLVDSLNGRVVVLSLAGEKVREYGSPGAGKGEFKVDGAWGPSSVAVDSEGNSYVTDTWNNRIIKFDTEGNPALSWGNVGNVDRPYPNLFFFPRAIAVGPDGLIYVADTGHHDIKVFDGEGKKIRTIGERGISKGQFDEPVGLKFGPDGSLYVCDTGNERIQVFRPNGSFKNLILVPGWSADKVGMEPFIDFLPDGRIVVSLSKKKMIRIYAPDGKSAKNFSVQNGEPIGVLVDSEGKIWLGDRTRNQIYRVTAP